VFLDQNISILAEKSWASLFQIFAKCSSQIQSTKRNEARDHVAAQFLNELRSCNFEVVLHEAIICI